MTDRSRMLWTLAITSVAVFMVSLDNLVVTTALPVIKRHLGASLSSLEWMVNAYTLTFAVLLLTGAALGDRFGRKRMFVAGMAIFTIGSAAAALAPTAGSLIASRALQGVGGAIVTPLTLTILSAAVAPERRGMMLGIWGGVAGLAVAIGPLVGGAVVDGLSWQWIFWLNVPIGLAVLPLAWSRLTETTGPNRSFDVPGLALVSAGLFGIVFGLVRGNEHGWGSFGVAGPLAIGGTLVVAFVAWELLTAARGGAPMIPMGFFAKREFSAANVVSLLMYFGMFGSIFLLAQFFQVVQGYSPLEAGLRTLPWTAMPILVAPIAGLLSDRVGSRPLLVVGMGLMSAALAWLALIASPAVAYLRLVPPFVMAGVGMSLYFAPTANLVLSAVRRDQEGKASGVNNTIREIGGVFGVAVLATVFSAVGGYASPTAFVDGMSAAVWVGAVMVGLAAVAALAIPSRKVLALRPQEETAGQAEELEVERVA
jgi:EmrB/QacA subfamily drug resistance transporter